MSDALRAQLRAYVERHGEHRAAERLGCAKSTIARALASLPCQAGTVALVERALGVEAAQ